MPRVTSSARWLAPFAGLLFALLSPASGIAQSQSQSQSRVYKWVDENGQAHYTVERSEIPPNLRQRLRPGVVAPAAEAPTERVALEEIRPAFGLEASAGRTLPEPPGPPVDEMTALEAQIQRDRETLKDLISRRGLDGAEFTNDPRVREIAERLPRLQAELEALRREAAP